MRGESFHDSTGSKKSCTLYFEETNSESKCLDPVGSSHLDSEFVLKIQGTRFLASGGSPRTEGLLDVVVCLDVQT